MASIADLTVNLSLLTASFEANAKKTQSTLSGLKAGLEGLKGSVETVQRTFELFGIGLGVKELIEFTKQAIETAASINEMAAQTGLSTEQFQGLEFAAAKAGAPIESITTGMAHLTRAMGEAAAGSKSAIDAFNALGVGILDTAGKLRTPADTFGAVAKALADIRDPARRAAIEVALLGKSGQQMDAFVREFAEGKLSVDGLAKAAKDAGFAFDSDLIGRAGQVQGEFEVLKREAQTFVVFWTSEFIKALQGTPNAIDDALSGLQPLADFLNNLIKEENDFAATHRRLIDILRGTADPNSSNRLRRPLTDEELGLNGGLNGPTVNPPHSILGAGGAGAAFHNPTDSSAAKQITDVVAALKLQLANLQRTAEEQDVYNNLAKAGVSINSAAGQAIARLTTQITAQKAALESTNTLEQLRIQTLTQQDDALAHSFEIQKQQVDAAAERASSVQQEIADNQALLTALGEGAHAYAVEAQFLQLVNQARAAGQPLIGAEIDQARQQAETLVNQTERMQELQQQTQAAQQAFDDIGSAFVDGITGIQAWGDTAKQVLGDVLKLIIKLIAQQAILSLGGGGGGGGGGGILGSLFGSLFGSGGGAASIVGHAAVAGFASGGRPPVGVASMVGENGPELWVPDQAGTIIPNEFGGGGMTLVQHNSYDLRGTDISRAELEQKIKKGQRETYSAVFAGINGGGQESKSTGRRRR